MKASEVLDNLKRRFPNEPEYHQAVSEVLGTIEEAYNEDIYNQHPEFEKQLDRAPLYPRSHFLFPCNLDGR